MLYSSAHTNNDKYSSIRVLDETGRSLRHAVSETYIFNKFLENPSLQQNADVTKLRPHSTIELHQDALNSFGDSNGHSSSKDEKLLTANSHKPDPFEDILNNVKKSFDIRERDSPMTKSTNSLPIMKSESKSLTFPQPRVRLATADSMKKPQSNFLKSELNGDMFNSEHHSGAEFSDKSLMFDLEQNDDNNLSDKQQLVTEVGEAFHLPYHVLSEDELEEELLDEDEIPSRKESVMLRHEIIRSYSIQEDKKSRKSENKQNGLNTLDFTKGYVQLRFDASGYVGDDDELNKPESEVGGMFDHSFSTLSAHAQSLPSQLNAVDESSQDDSLAFEPNVFQNKPSNNSKRVTVDVAQLNRKYNTRPIPARSKHISVLGTSPQKSKFLRSPQSRVSTLFSTKSPDRRALESTEERRTVNPGLVFFGDGLFDFTEERNEEAVSFSKVMGDVRSNVRGKQELNLGYLLSPTITQNSDSFTEIFEDILLNVEVLVEGKSSPIPLKCSSKIPVSQVIAEVLGKLWHDKVTSSDVMSSVYTLKVCGYQEYLSNTKLLCEYEYMHRCVMERRNVRLFLLDSELVPRSLIRSDQDDIADCEPRIYNQFFERSLVTSVSRDGLIVLSEAFDLELKRLIDGAGGFPPCLQPGPLLQSVRAVCMTLGKIETKGIIRCVDSLRKLKAKYDNLCSDSPGTMVPIDLTELRTILQNLYRNVYLMMELYCNTFNTDFGKIRISEKIINGSIEVTQMTDKLNFFIPAAYRIPTEWKERFDTYLVEGKIYYGKNLLVVPETTILAEISTNFFPQIAWQCWMEFSIEICKLPRESRLCLTLYGLSPATKSGSLTAARTRTPLGWTAVQLFDFNGVLISGSQLFGLWPNEAANPMGSCTSNLVDKRSAILQVDFTSHLSDIVFPQLVIPEAKLDYSEDQSTDLFSTVLSKDIFEELRPEEKYMIWENRHLASKVL